MASGYKTFTTADNGTVLAFPLRKSNGNENDFSNARAQLELRDQFGTLYERQLIYSADNRQWEYAVVAGEFPISRFWAAVAVTFLDSGIGPVYSRGAIIFDVEAPY